MTDDSANNESVLSDRKTGVPLGDAPPVDLEEIRRCLAAYAEDNARWFGEWEDTREILVDIHVPALIVEIQRLRAAARVGGEEQR